MLVVPYSHDCSDWRFNATAVGWSSGKDWLRHLTDTFDTLYEEGEEGEAKMMTVSSAFPSALFLLRTSILTLSVCSPPPYRWKGGKGCVLGGVRRVFSFSTFDSSTSDS